MKKRSLITLILVALSCQVLLAQDEKIKKELEQLSWNWMNAWKAKDSITLQNILAPEYRLLALINGELVSINRERWLKTAPLYVPTKFRYYDFDIRVYGETAIVQSKVEQEATLNGQDRSGTFQVTDVWVKNKVGWQVAHRHTTLKPKATIQNSEAKEKERVTSTILAIAKAWTQNNLDTLNKYIGNEYLHTDVRGQALNRAAWLQYISDRKTKGIENPEVEFSDVNIKLQNDFAFVTGVNIFTGKAFEGKDDQGRHKLRFTQILQKENNVWKRILFQATYSLD